MAAHSTLTTDQAAPLIANALAAAPSAGPTAQANAASQAVASALPGVNVELSEAVMLNGTVRCWSAGAFALIMIGCICGVIGVGTESQPSETTLISLSVMAILALVAALTLVMGYKSVKVKLASSSS